MNVNKSVMILLIFYTFAALSQEMPEFCHSGAFTCHQLGPNSMVAYPIDKTEAWFKFCARL